MCLVDRTGVSIRFDLPKITDGSLSVRRADDGREVNPAAEDEVDAVSRERSDHRAGDWRVVTTDGATERLGPQCQQSDGVERPAPAAVVEWLSGATVEAVGVRGPARLSWDRVSFNGVFATHYEVGFNKVTTDGPHRHNDRFTPKPVDAVLVDGSQTSAIVDLGVSEVDGSDLSLIHI